MWLAATAVRWGAAEVYGGGCYKDATVAAGKSTETRPGRDGAKRRFGERVCATRMRNVIWTG